MNALPAPDGIHLQACQEFLRAGNFDAAAATVNKISAPCQGHPEVLEIHWELCAHEQKWEPALEIARTLCQLAPEPEYSWLCQICSLIELKRIQEAFELLVIVVAKFPASPGMAYNLACSACKLGRLPEALQWLKKTAELGGRAETKLMALSDPDFAPLLDEICAL